MEHLQLQIRITSWENLRATHLPLHRKKSLSFALFSVQRIQFWGFHVSFLGVFTVCYSFSGVFLNIACLLSQDIFGGVVYFGKGEVIVTSFPMIHMSLPPGNQWLLALRIFSTMRSASIRPDVITFNAAISACEKQGQWQQAWPVEMPLEVILCHYFLEQKIESNPPCFIVFTRKEWTCSNATVREKLEGVSSFRTNPKPTELRTYVKLRAVNCVYVCVFGE